MTSSTPSSTFHAHAVLSSGGLWQVSVTELPEVQDAHRSLAQLQTRVRKTIAQHRALDAESVVLDLTTSTGDNAFDELLTEARDTRRQAEQLAERARNLAEPLAQRLVRAGVSVRDAGTLLGISGASVSALVNTTTRKS